MSAKTLGAIGIAAGLLGIPLGLLSRAAGWLLAAAAILLGIAALLRQSEEQPADESRSAGGDDNTTLMAHPAILSGVIALLAAIFSAVTGWSLANLLRTA